MIDNKVFSVGSVWSIYAAINNSISNFHRVKMNKWEELRRFLININNCYIPKNSDILSKEKLHKVLTECFDPLQPEYLLDLFVIVLILSGLLRYCEVMVIMVIWIKVDKKTREFTSTTRI